MDNTESKDIGILTAKIHNLSTLVAELQRNQVTINAAVNETAKLAALNKLEITEKSSSLRNLIIVSFCLISALGGWGLSNAKELLTHTDNVQQTQLDRMSVRLAIVEKECGKSGK